MVKVAPRAAQYRDTVAATRLPESWAVPLTTICGYEVPAVGPARFTCIVAPGSTIKPPMWIDDPGAKVSWPLISSVPPPEMVAPLGIATGGDPSTRVDPVDML